jgi:hypothetical protein
MDSPEAQPEQQELLPPRPAATEPPAILELQQQSQDLKRLFNATFVALIALAVGVNLFMAKETRIVRRDIGEKRPLLLAECETFRKFREPEIRKFMSELHLYAASHRNFQTNILDRYRSAMPQYFSVPVVVSPRGNKLPVPRPPGQ